jgi:two-component system cell cycle response regulator
MARRVMVVDDNKDLVLILKRYLEAEGYEVIPAYDGPEALELVPTESPDVIVLDVYMPQMNGKEVLRRLKDDPATADIPVIMQTAASELQDFEDTAVAGADAHLPKPCDPPDLVLMIERLLAATDARDRAEAAGASPEDIE